MAIEEFGKSLLADVRKRKEDQAREARKREKKQALQSLVFKGVVGIGNTLLKDKADKFLESEQFYKENMQFKKGYNISNEYIAQEKEARNSTLGYDAYWTKIAPADQIDLAMTEKYGAESLYNISDWANMRSELMSQMGKAARTNHEKGLENAKSFINQAGDKGAEFYSNFAKQSRPSTIKDLITNTVRSSIGGKDLNVASRELTRKSYLGDAQALIAYDKTWDQTGSNQISEFFADTSQTLRSKAPVLKEEYVDLGNKDIFGVPKGKEPVIIGTFPNGDERIVNKTGEIAMSVNEAQDFSAYNDWVGKHSTDSIDAKAQQQIGMLALTKHATEEDTKFFNNIAKETGSKFFGNDRNKAVAQKNKSIQAHIAGLKLIYRNGYGMGEETSERLAVAMYRKQEEFIVGQKKSGVLGANPFSHGKTFGTMIAMAEQQALPSRPRNFSNADIEEVIASPDGKAELFNDYRQLTPKAMSKYDELVEQTGNDFVVQSHTRIKGLAKISNDNPKIKDLGTIEELYEKSLIKPPVRLEVVDKDLNKQVKIKDTLLNATPSLLANMPVPPALPTDSTIQEKETYQKMYRNQNKEYMKILKAQKTLQNNMDMTRKQGRTTSQGITSAQKYLNSLYTDYMNKYGD